MSSQLLEIGRLRTSKDACMDCRMQCLHSAGEQLGRTGILSNIDRLYASAAQCRCGTAGSEECPAEPG